MPSFAELREHIERALARAPRYRQKLAPVPLGLHAPEWIDDPAFSIDRHVYWAPGPLRETRRRGDVDAAAPRPPAVGDVDLRGRRRGAVRDRRQGPPLHGRRPRRGRARLAAARPHARARRVRAGRAGAPSPSPAASGCWRGARATSLGEQLGLLRWPLRAASVPARAARRRARRRRCARGPRARATLLRAAPASALNGPLSPLRRLAWAERPLEDLRSVKRAYGTTINDVMLAAVAGGMRAYLLPPRRAARRRSRRWSPSACAAPSDVLGNHISFVFAELPCEEPDPVGRLYQVHARHEPAQARRRARGRRPRAEGRRAHARRRAARDLSRPGQPAHVQPRGLQHPRPAVADVHARLPAAGHLSRRPARRPPRGLGRHDHRPRPGLLRRLRRPRGAARRRHARPGHRRRDHRAARRHLSALRQVDRC